nr:MAG TPA: hypothetical protein [Caudoviricetes sp.]
MWSLASGRFDVWSLACGAGRMVGLNGGFDIGGLRNCGWQSAAKNGIFSLGIMTKNGNSQDG